MARPISLFSIQAILILAIDDGSRILTKYYSNPHPPAGAQTEFPGQMAYKTIKDQKAFEKGLLEKTAKQTTDIILYDQKVVVFKMESDVMLYVVGGECRRDPQRGASQLTHARRRGERGAAVQVREKKKRRTRRSEERRVGKECPV